MPGPRHRVATALKPSERVEAQRIGMGEDDPRGPHRRGDHALTDDAVADGPRRLIAASADDRHSDGKAGRFCTLLTDLARDFGALVARRQKSRIDRQAWKAARGSSSGWRRRA